jgi:immunity protein 8 of polymorphic toxin system
MKPALRRLHSPDADDLREFVPSSPAFSLLVQVLVGPSDGPGEESFDVVVCSPEWLAERGRPIIGLHHIIVTRYHYDELLGVVLDYLDHCDGKDWGEVATKVGRLGRWEFEEYRPEG